MKAKGSTLTMTHVLHHGCNLARHVMRRDSLGAITAGASAPPYMKFLKLQLPHHSSRKGACITVIEYYCKISHFLSGVFPRKTTVEFVGYRRFTGEDVHIVSIHNSFIELQFYNNLAYQERHLEKEREFYWSES